LVVSSLFTGAHSAEVMSMCVFPRQAPLCSHVLVSCHFMCMMQVRDYSAAPRHGCQHCALHGVLQGQWSHETGACGRNPPYVPCSRALVLYMWALVCALSSLVTAWSFLCKPPVSLFVGEIPVLGFNALCAL
jgi:hypothetical protein